MIFKSTLFLWLIPFVVLLFIVKRKNVPGTGFVYPSEKLISGHKASLRLLLAWNLPFLRLASIILVALALARPEASSSEKVRKEGISIMLAVDCSSTMLSENIYMREKDLAGMPEPEGAKELTRLDAVKYVAQDFVGSRPNDLVGIVAFAAEAFIVCPLTLNHEWLLTTIKRVDVGMIKDGTAIGSGIMACLKSLKDVRAKSRVIILLTDGINNYGSITPNVAAKAARALGVKVYTIGIISKGQEKRERQTLSKEEKASKLYVEEESLEEIARITGGMYFKASDLKSLKKSYARIDRLERTIFEEDEYREYVDVFQMFLFPGLILLLVTIILSNTFLRKVP